MFTSRVLYDAIGARLDAEFYHPDYRANERRLKGCSVSTAPLRQVAKKLKCGPFGSSLHAEDYVSGGVPFVHPTCFSQGCFNPSKLLTISVEDSARLRSTEFKAPALIFTRVGDPDCCVVPAALGRFNIHGDVIGIETGAESDPHFICAFYESHVGLIELRRYQAGSTRPRTNTDSLAETLVLQPEVKVQNYVGSKMRHAERLRELAGTSRRDAEGHFREFCVAAISVGLKKCYRTRRQYIDGKRLDPSFYDPGQLALGESLTAAGYQPFNCLASCVTAKWHRKEPACLYYDIGSLDVGTGMIEGRVVATRDAPSRAQQLVRPWDLLVATVRPNRKNVALIPETSGNLPLVASTGFAVLRFGSPAEAVFYHAWLRTDASTHQLMRWNAGSAYPAIEEDAVTQVLAPPHVPNTVVACGTRWLNGMTAQEYSSVLVAAAKYLVEALIDGKVSETDLVQAQDALERHDRGPDRALLARLTAQGMDVPNAKPLFPDLDKLYELLDQNDGDNSNGDAQGT